MAQDKVSYCRFFDGKNHKMDVDLLDKNPRALFFFEAEEMFVCGSAEAIAEVSAFWTSAGCPALDSGLPAELLACLFDAFAHKKKEELSVLASSFPEFVQSYTGSTTHTS